MSGTESSAIASNPLLGNSLALVGSWAISGYLLLGREAQRRGMGIGSYAAIAYSSAALILLPLPLLWGTNYFGYPPSVYGYLLLMAIGPQLIGHTSFNWALRWISPTLVTLVILFEPVGASILGYFIFGELPGIGVIGGAVVLLIGVAIVALASRPLPSES
ncbi:EamA family transporter [Oscillatoria acuminata]|uniref:EamA family transporter n=1 Tax=Oscillatoria acuminata TaxID=118323 RepID=UPI0002F7E90C